MGVQEHVALARSLFDLLNHRRSDPAWIEKGAAAFAADCEIVDVPSGATFHGPDGYKRFMRFFVEAFPDLRIEPTNALATEDQVVLETTFWGNNTGPLHLPSGALPATGCSFELRMCHIFQFRNGKIVSVHCYYDMVTLLEQLGFNAATR